MQFWPAEVEGAWRVEPEPIRDSRGFFARTFCAREFASHGIEFQVAQASSAFTSRKGTVRGLHQQLPPHAEQKFVRCVKGAAYVVIADLREDSPSAGRWVGFELTGENHVGLFVPRGCLQGYQTLAEDTELLYEMSEFYAPESATGVRYDDPKLAIRWPLEVTVVSERDRAWPFLADKSSDAQAEREELVHGH